MTKCTSLSVLGSLVPFVKKAVTMQCRFSGSHTYRSQTESCEVYICIVQKDKPTAVVGLQGRRSAVYANISHTAFHKHTENETFFSVFTTKNKASSPLLCVHPPQVTLQITSRIPLLPRFLIWFRQGSPWMVFFGKNTFYHFSNKV